jgi:hypothetical protein
VERFFVLSANNPKLHGKNIMADCLAPIASMKSARAQKAAGREFFLIEYNKANK